MKNFFGGGWPSAAMGHLRMYLHISETVSHIILRHHFHLQRILFPFFQNEIYYFPNVNKFLIYCTLLSWKDTPRISLRLRCPQYWGVYIGYLWTWKVICRFRPFYAWDGISWRHCLCIVSFQYLNFCLIYILYSKCKVMNEWLPPPLFTFFFVYL